MKSMYSHIVKSLIFSYYEEPKKLEIIKNNKKLQTFMNISIDNYKLYFLIGQLITEDEIISNFLHYFEKIFPQIKSEIIQKYLICYLLKFSQKSKIKITPTDEFSSLVLEKIPENISITLDSKENNVIDINLVNKTNIVEVILNIDNWKKNINELYESILPKGICSLQVYGFQNNLISELLRKISNYPNISSLSLPSSFILLKNDLKSIESLTNLSTIRLQLKDKASSYSQFKPFFKKIKKLSSIDFYFIKKENFKFLDLLGENKKTIKEIKLTNANITHYHRFKEMKALNSLSFWNCVIKNVSYNIQNLKTLILLQNIITVDCIIKIISNNPLLEKINIRFFFDKNEKIENLKLLGLTLSQLKFLSEISLENATFTNNSKLINLEPIFDHFTCNSLISISCNNISYPYHFFIDIFPNLERIIIRNGSLQFLNLIEKDIFKQNYSCKKIKELNLDSVKFSKLEIHSFLFKAVNLTSLSLTNILFDINNFITILKNISIFSNLRCLYLSPFFQGGYSIDFSKIFDSFFQSLKKCLFLHEFIYGKEGSRDKILIIKNSIFPFLHTIVIENQLLKSLFLNSINNDGKMISKSEKDFFNWSGLLRPVHQ